MIKIAIDAMGGDNAPQAIVQGALDALKLFDDLALVLCGPEKDLQALVQNAGYSAERLSILDAPEVITNHESPTLAIRRKTESSLVKAMMLVKSGECQAMVSAGSTGAVLAAGIFRLGRIPGVERPALATAMPTLKENGRTLLLDCGANVDCKPEYLAQFGVMGAAYATRVLGMKDPSVALLNIGAEEEKGNDLTKKATPLLKEQPIRFIGNVEARDVMQGAADVIVADGFAGNTLLKSIEGTAMAMMKMVKNALYKNIVTKIGALLVKGGLMELKKKMDYTEYGGAPLLGLAGEVVKAHGSSDAKAFCSAVRQAYTMTQNGVSAAIAAELGRINQA